MCGVDEASNLERAQTGILDQRLHVKWGSPADLAILGGKHSAFTNTNFDACYTDTIH
jgi:hypothetical protein